MKNAKANVNVLLKRVTERMIRREVEGWPPDCVTFAYQPKRPNRQDSAALSVVRPNQPTENEKR